MSAGVHALSVIENVTVPECHSLSCSLTRRTFYVRCNCQGGAVYAAQSSSIDIQHSSFVGNSAVCFDLAFGCLSCALSHCTRS